MKKLGLFILNYTIFFSLLVIVTLGFLSALYLGLSFLAWKLLVTEHFTSWALLTIRVAILISLLATTHWIFREGRREWDV